MHTAALLAVPVPRRIAGRPVDWMVEIMLEGGVVVVVVRSWVGREKEVDWMPSSRESAREMSWMQESQCMGTEKVAS